MKFIINHDVLLKGIQVVEKAVSSKSTIPIVSNILIEAKKNGKVTLSGNDLEVGIEVKLSAKVEDSGSVLAPAKTFTNIINKLPNDNVVVEVDGSNNIKIECARSKFNIRGLSSNDFPKISKLENSKKIRIKRNVLSEMIKQTIFSVSMDESKQILNGILFDINKNELSLIATDGYRLAYRKNTIENIDGKNSMVVPTKVLSELIKIIKDGDENNIELGICSDQISFDIEDIYIVSRLVQGKFPDYRLVIPKDWKAKVDVLRKDLLEATERSQVIASTSANIIKIEISKDKMLITANSSEVGNVSELIDVSVSGKSEIRISFNVRLILDVLRSIDDESVELCLGEDELSAGIIRPKDKAEYTYVLMPIRTVETVKV